MVTQSIASIVTRYEALGPQHLAGEARVIREMLHGMLAGQQPPRVRAELFRLASQAAGLLGYMAVNAGARFDVVDAYCTEAETLAREVGEVSMEMWASGTRSLGLYYHKRYPEAGDAAAAGIALAPDNAQAIRLLVNGRSRALARLGDRSGAEQAIGQAFELSDRQSSLPDGLTSCISFEPYSMARTLANAVTTRLSLGDTAQVLTHAEQIEDLVEQSHSEWSRALIGLDVASALLKQSSPEVEHAMALGRRALRASTTPPIKSVWERAAELYESAEQWHDEPDVGDYAEELRAWRSQPQAEMITVGSHAQIAL
jgi:tetratricopeptide (TPR) repeat protein